MCDRLQQLVSGREMAELLGLKPNTWRDLARRRRFPHWKVGRSVRFDPAEILDLLRDDGGRP